MPPLLRAAPAIGGASPLVLTRRRRGAVPSRPSRLRAAAFAGFAGLGITRRFGRERSIAPGAARNTQRKNSYYAPLGRSRSTARISCVLVQRRVPPPAGSCGRSPLGITRRSRGVAFGVRDVYAPPLGSVAQLLVTRRSRSIAAATRQEAARPNSPLLVFMFNGGERAGSCGRSRYHSSSTSAVARRFDVHVQRR